MSPKIKLIRDTITPDLHRKAAAVKNRRPLLSAMGQAVKSLGERAFTDSGLRASPWTERKDNKPHALLQDSTTLVQSIRVTSVTNDRVTVGSDRPYAATHQLGSKKLHIPARPFLPFKGGKLTAKGDQNVTAALKGALKRHGL